MMAVCGQYELSPTALTTEATHEGRFATFARVIGVGFAGAHPAYRSQIPLPGSVKILVCGAMMSLYQSGPLRTYCVCFQRLPHPGV